MPIDHFSHHHPLGLGLCSHKETEEPLNCNGCEQLINSGSQMYSCENCKYYLHKSCVELEKEIQHRFHPQHTLILLAQAPSFGGNFERDACEKQGCTGFVYRCHECDFNLEIQCTNSLKAVVNSPRAHEHSLVYIEKKSYASMCNCSCGKYSYGQIFRCVQCRFNIKFDCFPFPKAVKIKYHRHAITFSYPPSTEEEEEEEEEEEDDCDSDCEEYLCDPCEKDLDPKQPVYSCTKCDFISHQLCGVTEGEYIVDENLPLSQKLRDLKLGIDMKSAAYKLDEKHQEEEIKPTLTLMVFSDSILEEDNKEELNSVLGALTNEKVGFKDMFLNDQKEDDSYNNLEASLYQTMAFTKFMKMFENYTQCVRINFKNVEITADIVTVGDYMIPKNIAPTLEALVAKYGDISEESKLSSNAKMCVINNLCDAIYGMQSTKFVQLSESQLFSWWLSFKYAQHAGFKVQFIVDQLKRLMRTKMIARVKDFSEHVVEEIDKRNVEIQLKLKKLEEWRAKQAATMGTKFREFCSREVSALESENAGTGLL